MGIHNRIDSVNSRTDNIFDSFFHRLSHELRTPLNQINGFAELLLMDKDLSPASVEYVRAILSGVETLTAAVTSHLNCAEKMVREPISGYAARHPTSEGSADPSLGAPVGIAGVAPIPSAVERPTTVEKFRPDSVVAPVGQPITLASLAPANTKRWIAHRKAEVVAAVQGGVLTLEAVCERYNIEPAEFAAWERGVERLGTRDFCVTRSR